MEFTEFDKDCFRMQILPRRRRLLTTRLNALSFDPSANNDPLQFSGSSGPLVTECPPLENTAENSKKRKRANLPPGLYQQPRQTQTFIIQSTADIKRLVNLSSSSSSSPSAGPGHVHGQPQTPGLAEKNGFAGRIHHLPDLIQQSHHSPSSTTTIPSSPSSSPSFPSSSSYASPAMSPQTPLDTLTAIESQSESNSMSKHKSSSSFTPFIDPRLLQISPSSGSSLNNIAAFGPDGRLADPLKADPSRKGSVVNVNPVNTRPPSDTPEIRKYKKRFNSEILCAALWGVNLLVGTESGLMLLDRSGQGKVYPLINRRRIQQMDVLEGLNVLVTISGTVHVLSEH
ncbi:TRAF2 and NCK-interacting protein kinase-like [Notothenia coriiceps]|uniref:non-specific serine/threonine protein kinase n=1 Tax=Notothenia coriiceps TaxID=8208 RepID=A0A6I9PXZ8_9TELE|nr:PREDICTED: TRAF2 and NCK-interacting protein kinase-like [Notothenia coriiceps]